MTNLGPFISYQMVRQGWLPEIIKSLPSFSSETSSALDHYLGLLVCPYLLPYKLAAAPKRDSIAFLFSRLKGGFLLRTLCTCTWWRWTWQKAKGSWLLEKGKRRPPFVKGLTGERLMLGLFRLMVLGSSRPSRNTYSFILSSSTYSSSGIQSIT